MRIFLGPKSSILKARTLCTVNKYLILPLWYGSLLTPNNLAAGKLTAFILCSARKKLANLLTFAVLNHSIQVYLSAFKRIREPDIWNWTQFIDCFYLLDQKHDFWPLNLLVFRLTVLSSLIPRTISKRSKDFLITWQIQTVEKQSVS